MFDDLLKFSVKEVAVGVLLAVVVFGGGLAAVVALVPRSAGGELTPPALPIPPTQPVAPPTTIQPPNTIQPVTTETGAVTLPPVPPIQPPNTIQPVTTETGAVSVPPIPPIPPQREAVSLIAEDFAVTVGAGSTTWLNPLLYAYDTGEQGSDGVDVDRDTLQIISVTPASGTVQITNDGRAVIYTPATNADQSDSFAYTVQTTAQGIVKMASGLVTVTTQAENFAENLTELNSLLQRHFDADTDASVRANFRFTDGQVTNQDLQIVKYFAEQNFSDDSVQLIMDLGAALSPLTDLDQYSLTKLNSIEKSLYQNPVFTNNPHGTANWPADYTKIMKQASFIIPSRIAVIDGLKHIYYDKLVLDEIFETLGGEYTGVFSRGQNYTPFWVDLNEATQEQQNYYADFARKYFNSSGEGGYLFGYVFDGGREYLDNLNHPRFHWNELAINFSILSTLDSTNHNLSSKLVDKNDTEIFFLFDHLTDLEANRLRAPAGTFGDHGYIIPWETGKYSNGELNNLHNLSRNIIGKNTNEDLESIFKLFDWLHNEKIHEIGRPYFINYEHSGFTNEEVDKLKTLSNDAFFPVAYHFIEKNKGGVWFSSSFQMAGHVTGGLRSVGIPSEQFNNNQITNDFDSELSRKYLGKFFQSGAELGSPKRDRGVNFGLILVNGLPWFYNGNFPFANSNDPSYESLISQENFTFEIWQKIINGELSGPALGNYYYNNQDLREEYENLIGS